MLTLLLLSVAGIACGEDEASAPPPPPPPIATDESAEESADAERGDAEDESTTTEASSNVEEVSLSTLADLCELLPIEDAQRIDPEIETPGGDPDEPRDPDDYWCDWLTPRPVDPNDEDPWEPGLRGVGIIDSNDVDWEVVDDEPDYERVDDVGTEAVFYVGTEGPPGEITLSVRVVSSDGSSETGFTLGGGARVCPPPATTDVCEPDLAYATPERREEIIAVGAGIAEQALELLDDR